MCGMSVLHRMAVPHTQYSHARTSNMLIVDERQHQSYVVYLKGEDTRFNCVLVHPDSALLIPCSFIAQFTLLVCRCKFMFLKQLLVQCFQWN